MKVFVTFVFILGSYLVTCGQTTRTLTDREFSYVLTIDTVLCGGTTGSICSTVKSIDIYTKANNKISQTIIPDEYLIDWFDSSKVCIIEDVNFDGHNDVRLLNWTSINLQTSYWYWIYNASSGQFQSDTTLEEYTNPYFDSTSKTFHTWWRIGFENYGHARYAWNNGNLQLIASEEESWVYVDKGYLITKKTENGTIKILYKKIKKPSIKYLHNTCKLCN
jgi:hypothetical protein